MPGVASPEEFQRAVDACDITASRLTIDPAALAAARQSLDQSGLLLLGEVYGVRQNPELARELMAALDVTGLALEWPATLAGAVSGFFSDGQVPDQPQLWSGDGRITAGHFALLRERFLAGRLHALTLFDGVDEIGWSQCESAMAERILNAARPGTRTLVVAGNAHTALTPTMLGVPLGARLAEWRPGVREIKIRYGSGSYYHRAPQQFEHQFSLRRRARLSAEGAALILDLPGPVQADVPHRTATVEPGYPDFPHYQAPPVDQPGITADQPGITADHPVPPQTAPLPRRSPGAGMPADPSPGRHNPYQPGLTPR